MVKRVVFEVRFDADARAWKVYRDGEYVLTNGAGAFEVKTEAVQAAVELMKREVKSELKVKNKKGRITERRTWPRSSDPKGRG